MTERKQRVIENLCYTDLVYQRINKKLSTNLSKDQIESLIVKILRNTNEKFYIKSGKNFYVTDARNNVRLTINSSTCRIITVDILAGNNPSIPLTEWCH